MKNLLFSAFALCVGATLHAQSNYATPYTFTTLAGVGGGAADGSGTSAQFNFPVSVASDSAGNLYVTDTSNNTIRKISSSGVVTTLAGSPGTTGSADGTGSAAQFNNPQGVAVDSAGNVYVADTSNQTIRKITSAGVVTTLAGSAGVAGAVDATGSAARFRNPGGVAVDAAGIVYVADTGNHAIRRILTNGAVHAVAGSGIAGAADGTGVTAQFNFPHSVAVDGAGNLYVADTSNNTIRKITSVAAAGGGVVTTLAGTAGVTGSANGTGAAAQFNYPYGLALDSAGNLYVAELNCLVRQVSSAGVVSTLAGLPGGIGYADGTGTAARFNLPRGVALDAAGNIYVADSGNQLIRKVSSGNVVTTFAGRSGGSGSMDGLAGTARFNLPRNVAIDSAGNVYVSDSANNTIRKITAAGVVSTLAGLAGSNSFADGTGSVARFSLPRSVAVDTTGNIYVADTFNRVIRKITSDGTVTTLAGSPGTPGSVDGTGSAARFNTPSGLTVDAAGNVYVADSGDETIRKITSAGVVTTFAGSAGSAAANDGTGSAARFFSPNGIAVDSAGNLYVADSDNQTIRKITNTGVVTTLAGSAGQVGSTDGAGTAARFFSPIGLTVDAAGDVYVADTGNHVVRKITSGGVVTTLAGLATVTGSADGVGSNVRFFQPTSVTVDSVGHIYVADSGNNTIRLGTSPSSPPVPTLTSAILANGTVGQSFSYTATFSGSPTGYNAGGLPAGLTFDTTTGVISGTPTVAGTFSVALTASSAAGTGSATLEITIADIVNSRPGRLINLSVRTGVGTGNNVLIAGLVIAGEGTSGPKPLLIRGVGPTLANYSVSGAIVDPSMQLIQDGAVVASNDNWSGDAQITSVGNSVGAFPLPDPASKDSALYVTPPSGVYTVKISGVGNTTGIALAEIYDASGSSFTSTTPRLVNVSTRAFVGTGDGVLIAGFVIAGDRPLTVLIRGMGPTLTNYGVPGVLADPQLEVTQLVNGSNVTIATNDNWAGSADITSVAKTVGAFDFISSTSKDAAVVLTLPPGVYSAKVTGVGGTTGVALVEVYEVP